VRHMSASQRTRLFSWNEPEIDDALALTAG
jgi:hypothetical protein